MYENMFEKVDEEKNETNVEMFGFAEEMVLMRTASILNRWVEGPNLFKSWKLFVLWCFNAQIELLFLFN